MSFFHRPRREWLIEKLCAGKYHNSPAVWRVCGVVPACDRQEALTKARRVVGSWGDVRVSIYHGRLPA